MNSKNIHNHLLWIIYTISTLRKHPHFAPFSALVNPPHRSLWTFVQLRRLPLLTAANTWRRASRCHVLGSRWPSGAAAPDCAPGAGKVRTRSSRSGHTKEPPNNHRPQIMLLYRNSPMVHNTSAHSSKHFQT